MLADDITLVETLRLAVPLHIADLAELTPQQRQTIAQRCAQTVGENGDALQFPATTAKGRRTTGEAFTALARGLAAAAFQPGGITFAGIHWQATTD